MIWIMLATLAVVFVVGFRLLTARARHAAQALSKRLNVPPVHVESLLSLMGKNAGQEFTDYIAQDDEHHLHTAAVVLLVWQVFIVDSSEENLLRWHGILRKAGFPTGITRQQSLLALGFLRELDPESSELHAFRQHYNDYFAAEMGQTLTMEADHAPVSLSDYRRRD